MNVSIVYTDLVFNSGIVAICKCLYLLCLEGNEMLKFIDDLAGAIFDVFMLFCYFLAGVIIVGVPIFLLAKFFLWFQ